MFMLRSYHPAAVLAMHKRVDPHDFTQTLDARLLALADLNRVPLIENLILLDTRAQARVRAGRRAARDSVIRRRADEARIESDRFGRIIYFLRFRTLADRSTIEEAALCSSLADNLTAKGQWSGDYSL
jgi:hypothetical protein